MDTAKTGRYCRDTASSDLVWITTSCCLETTPLEKKVENEQPLFSFDWDVKYLIENKAFSLGRINDGDL